MYRLVLFSLALLAFVAIILGFFGVIAFGGIALIVSLVVILFSSFIANTLFAKIWKAPANVESVWITGYILFFLLEPLMTVDGVLTLVAASIIAMLSKYIFAIGKRHLFNPAAVAALVLSLSGSGAVVWWVATPILSVVTLVVGLMIVRKIRRFKMFMIFVLVAIVTLVFTYLLPGGLTPMSFIGEILFSWPIIFFATIMLTEPLTTPPTTFTQGIYAAIVGLFFSSQLHLGAVYATPEFALIVGNIYSYIVSSKQKLLLKLVEIKQISATIFDLTFDSNIRLRFNPGQYLEWTLPHQKPDSRGNRRYFTVASSPTEKDIHVAVRVAPKQSSSFKTSMLHMHIGDTMVASHLMGDFVLPADVSKKLVFIAGGIGVTPFRSMIKYLADKKEKRDIVLFYQTAKEEDLAFRDFFEIVKEAVGIKTVYVVTEPDTRWQGMTGRLTEKMIKGSLPDYDERIFFLSGPNPMVQSYKKLLLSLGIQKINIKTDYFPGF
jgi:ferredoxin-NADP reductase